MDSKVFVLKVGNEFFAQRILGIYKSIDKAKTEGEKFISFIEKEHFYWTNEFGNKINCKKKNIFVEIQKYVVEA